MRIFIFLLKKILLPKNIVVKFVVYEILKTTTSILKIYVLHVRKEFFKLTFKAPFKNNVLRKLMKWLVLIIPYGVILY
jgi:hypothetical protein